VSIAAAKRLLAAVTAWISPVRWRLNSSIGTTCAYPPPAAPPLIPNVGPWDGWRIQAKHFFPRVAPSAWASPIVVANDHWQFQLVKAYSIYYRKQYWLMECPCSCCAIYIYIHQFMWRTYLTFLLQEE
jgi:hypothetical protein